MEISPKRLIKLARSAAMIVPSLPARDPQRGSAVKMRAGHALMPSGTVVAGGSQLPVGRSVCCLTAADVPNQLS